MKLYHMFTGDLGVNTYFLVNENDRAAVVDPGEDGAAVLAFAEKHGFKITACYLTHGHFDHMGCCKRLQDLGVKIYVSEKDADKLYTDKNEGAVFGRRVEPLHADNTFRDGDVLDFEGFKLRVMETPGHTAGSVCFFTELGIFAVKNGVFSQTAVKSDLSNSAVYKLVEGILADD